MNKSIIISLLIAMICFHCESLYSQNNEPVPLHIKTGSTIANGNSNEQPGPARSPIYIPSVFLADHTLYFEESCIGCEVLILQDDEVVYSAVVDENGTVELPDALYGVYEIQLYQGSRTFVGEFEL